MLACEPLLEIEDVVRLCDYVILVRMGELQQSVEPDFK